MSIDTTPGMETSIGTEPGFDLSAYLGHRQTAPSFVFVEIGHGRYPIAPHLSDLTGQRSYVGIESWIRGLPTVHAQIKQTLAELSVGKNIFFLDHPLEGDLVPQREHHGIADFVGDYDPQTILPDGAADEVFISNVFGDPQIAETEGRTEALLAEGSRLLVPGGKLVVRETITPGVNKELTDENLNNAGLVRVDKINEHSKEWRMLEQTAYMGGNTGPRTLTPTLGYYMFAEAL